MTKKTPAPQKPRTYVALILDKSGSMKTTKESAISGFNEQVQQLKMDSKNQEILCSLVTFDGEVFEHLWNVPAEQLAEADPSDYVPEGSTAMRDAVGYTVQKLLSTTDHSDINNSYLIVVISDGETNQDKHYNVSALRELTTSVQNTKRWTFTYIGCGEEYLKEIARQTGTPLSNMAAWSNTTDQGTEKGFSKIRSRQAKFFEERIAGQVSSGCYASDNIGVVADYLNFDEKQVDVATPVVVSAAELQAAAEPRNLDEILAGTPKYVDQNSVSYNGEALFKNKLQVQWEVNSGRTAGSNVGMSQMWNSATTNP